jgi:hypothetical protein
VNPLDALQPQPLPSGLDAVRESIAAEPRAATEFATLLEQLERLGVRGDAAMPSSPAEVSQAMQSADQDFVTAMDLARRLEQAYRLATRPAE